MKFVEKEFQDYMKAVYKNQQLSRIQIEECRKAFFMGATTTLVLITEAANISEDAVLKALKDTEQEIANFVKNVNLNYLKTD